MRPTVGDFNGPFLSPLFVDHLFLLFHIKTSVGLNPAGFDSRRHQLAVEFADRRLVHHRDLDLQPIDQHFPFPVHFRETCD
jgi:hypothetical protein